MIWLMMAAYPLEPQHGDVARFDEFGIVRVSIREALEIGDVRFVAEERDDQLWVDSDSDGTVDTPIPREGAIVTLTTGYQIRVESIRTHKGGERDTTSWLYRTDTRLVGEGPGGAIALIDANGNGRFGDPLEDLVVERGDRQPRVFESEMDFGRARWRLRVDGRTLEAEEIGEAARPRASGIVRTINEWRMRAGVPPVFEDRYLSDACDLHARYLAAHEEDLQTASPHDENREYRDYTEEGHAAGMNSYIGFGYRSLDEFFLGNQRTFYHRPNYYAPGMRTVGISQRGTISMIDVGSCGRAVFPDRAHPIVLPFAGATDIPTAFTRESPDPTQTNRTAESYGMPIQAVFPDSARLEEATIHVEDEFGRAVPGRANTPTSALVTDFPMRTVVGFLPDYALAAGRTYFVTVDCRWNGRAYRREWSFRTRE